MVDRDRLRPPQARLPLRLRLLRRPPNAGKSTLTNALIGTKIAITSSRPQTTRHAVRGILHRPDAQLVLVDTPACTSRAPCSATG
jgi:GTPase Era involved in 16S rRNA processing